ncbi:MAG TPA: PQQ-binding-like beta-propeller repeat protein, partial [Fimbriimonadaceae bacterium]|nr:PQQ-binding-like beta-propeller repeat protein [Fimbriimonadaceae bacterium]
KPGSHFDKVQARFKEINDLKPDFVLNTGDVCEVGTKKEYELYRTARAVLNMPCYDCPGNHDVRWNPLGKNGYEVGTNQPLYQSWTHKGVHFVLLDSTVLLSHLGHFGQAMLEWLRQDLAKVGTKMPILLGFHHWIGRESLMVDNERTLREMLRGYNVVLWLQGHGHSDIQWNFDGTPAIMSKGLYQGSYNIIEFKGEQFHVKRRTDAGSQAVLSGPLTRPKAPKISVQAKVVNGVLDVTTQPRAGEWRIRIGAGAETAIQDGMKVEALAQGRHRLAATLRTSNGSFTTYTDFVVTGNVKEAWRTRLDGEVQSKMVLDGDTVFVSTMSGSVYALNASSGKVKWRARAQGAVFSAPAIDAAGVYFGSADGSFTKVERASGKPVWSVKTGGGVYGGGAVAQGRGIFGSRDQTIYVLNSETGAVERKVPAGGLFQSMATTDGSLVFLGCWDQKVYAVDPLVGLKWTAKFGRSFYFSPAIASPTVAGGLVYAASNDGVLHALNALTGEVKWEFDGKKVAYSTPLVVDGVATIALGDEGKVFAFDALTGTTRWEGSTGMLIYDSSLCTNGSLLFVGSVNGTLHALDRASGEVRWRYALGGGHLLASPAARGNRVFVGDLSGDVVALEW